MIVRSEFWSYDAVERTLFVVDTSLSSSADDIEGTLGVKVSRLDAMKSLLRELDMSGREFALATFSDSAKLQLPFSPDRSLWNTTIDALSPVSYGSPTDIETALLFAETLYTDIPLHIVVLTDGEQTWEGSMTGITLSGNHELIFIWVGTDAGSPLVSHYDGSGQRVYKRYNWQEIVSRLDREHLEELATEYNAKVLYLEQIQDIPALRNELDTYIHTSRIMPTTFSLIIALSLVLLCLILPAWHTLTPWKKSSSSSR